MAAGREGYGDPYVASSLPELGPGSIQTTVLQEKRLRKAAEEDALRLYNRVRQLQREEQKAEKRIEETKERANEVLSLRERNVQKAREKELRLRELQVEVAKQRKSNVKRKEVTRRNKELRETQIMELRDQMAQEVRIERAVLEDELQREKILARKRAVEQKEQIRRAKEEATQKLEQRKLAELINAHEDYQQRVAEEMAVRRKKEQELHAMAKVELQLIERLKKKQQEQVQAYTELEDVLGTRTLAQGGTGGGSRIMSSRSAGAPQARGSSAGRGTTAHSSGQGHPAGADAAESTSAVEQGSPGAAREPTEEEIAVAFSRYDDEGTGTIPTTSLEGLMSDLGLQLNAHQLSQAVAQLDRTGMGEVSFGEFLLWWRG